jgi:hypothetical protein
LRAVEEGDFRSEIFFSFHRWFRASVRETGSATTVFSIVWRLVSLRTVTYRAFARFEATVLRFFFVLLFTADLSDARDTGWYFSREIETEGWSCLSFFSFCTRC